MSRANDKKLDQVFRKMIFGLQAERERLVNRFEQEIWRPLSYPFSIQQGLSTYTKDELSDIRQKLDIKKASTLKKQELIDLLSSVIPVKLETILANWDRNRYELLQSIISGEGYAAAPTTLTHNELRHLRSTGIIFTGMIDDKKVLAIPSEIFSLLK